MIRDECPICKSGAFGLKWTRDYFARDDITAQDLATHFSITTEDVMDHINNHEICVGVTTTSNGRQVKELRSPDLLLDELGVLYSIVRDCVEYIRQDGEWDTVKIDQLTKLSKECTNIISKIGEFQGRLKPTTTIENKILHVEGNLNTVTSLLSGGILCPTCQKKADRMIEDITPTLIE
jgi:hypothetical protein